MTKRDDRFDRLFDSGEQVLGPVEEITVDDVTEMLEESGIDTEALSRRMYEKLTDLAGRYYSKNQDVPVQVAQALDQFRPADIPTSDPATAAQRARQLVAKLLAPRPAARALEVGYSFRNRKGELSSEDNAILESIAEKLRTKVQRKD
jgi:hypothetical protein